MSVPALDGGGENDIDDVIDDDDEQEAAHVSRYPQVEAEVPLLRRALQLLAIFGAPGPQKTLQHLSNVGKRTFFLL